MGSTTAAIIGYVLLHISLPKKTMLADKPATEANH